MRTTFSEIFAQRFSASLEKGADRSAAARLAWQSRERSVMPESPKGVPWRMHAVGLPRNTLEHFTRHGRLHPARAALHAEIVGDFLSSVQPVPPDKTPRAIVMMGVPASGKSTMVAGIDRSSFVAADPDEIKKHLPEYREAVRQKAVDAGTIVHRESAALSHEVVDGAIRQRKNLIYDSSGRAYSEYLHLINNLKAHGYHVTLMMPHVETDGPKGAIARSNARAEVTGRVVPEHTIRDAADRVPSNFLSLRKVADDFSLFDNRGDKIRLAWDRRNGKETEHDPAFVREFKGKGRF